mmetsp:Transcript_14619/g.31190  ORF Transcript_14619/g.31190 Transcript_14619/m.31190 type:complete len:235 (-) Transcript_14619:30-734(-)
MKSNSNMRISVFIASTSLAAFTMSACFSILRGFFFSSSSFFTPLASVDSSSLFSSPSSLTTSASITEVAFVSIKASKTPASTPISSISSNTAAFVISLVNSATSFTKSAASAKKSRSNVINAVPSAVVSPSNAPPPFPSAPNALHRASSNPFARNSLAAAALPLVALTMLYLYESYLEFNLVTLRKVCLGIPIFNLDVGRSIPPPPPPFPLMGPLSNLRSGGTLLFPSEPDRSS